ncbi:MAG: M67 family metallopeptidase [Planctomycetes bacterium]|nr:M67 family metallopeptidase [Planctomycetota bacterium]
MSTSGGGELVFPRELRARLEAWARESYPLEACGLLLGRREGERVEVVDARRYPNAVRERAHERFELAPPDLMAADREARELGLSLVGTWHSHPDRPATPSALDRAAAWPDGVQAIVSITASGVSEVEAFLGERARPRERSSTPQRAARNAGSDVGGTVRR